MRVAMAQVRLDHASRSATIQDIMSAVDRAADTDPAPDLVVLPGGCDGDGRGNAAVRESVVEAIAHRAREWGVYVAAGMHGVAQREACALLFDADGDMVACTSELSAGEPDSDVSNVVIHESPCGAIGVVEATSIGYRQACESTAGCEAVMAVPIPDRGNERSAAARANIESFLLPAPVASGAHWAVVLPAQRDPGPSQKPASHREGSVLWAPSGSPLAAADGSDEAIVFVDVPIAPKDIR